MFSWLGHRTMQGILNSLKSSDLIEARERGKKLGRLLHQIDPKWKLLAEQQVERILGADGTSDIVIKNYEHYGQMLAEIACFDVLQRNIDDWFEVENAQHVDVLDNGGMVISAHLGNWEVMGLHHTSHYQPVSALVKPIGNKYLEAWINQIRAACNIDTIVTRDNALGVRKKIRQGKVLVTLADQNSLYHEGVFTKFFDQPASTHYGPAMLAVQSGAPVMTAFCTRTDEGKFCVAYDAPISYEDGDSLREKTWLLSQAFTSRIENAVRACPEQWFWIHKRWKNQPRDQDPDWKYGPDGRSWLTSL